MDKSAVSLRLTTQSNTYKLYLKQQGDSLKGKCEYLIWERGSMSALMRSNEGSSSRTVVYTLVGSYSLYDLTYSLVCDWFCPVIFFFISCALLTLCAVQLKSSSSSSFHPKGFLKNVKTLCDSFLHNEKMQSQKNNKIHFTWTRSLSYLFNFTEIYPWIEGPWMIKVVEFAKIWHHCDVTHWSVDLFEWEGGAGSWEGYPDLIWQRR